MEQVAIVLTLAGFVAVWMWFLYSRSPGRLWSPLWMAFATTALAALFLVAGTLGYRLSKHERFVSGTAWTDDVIWWEVWIGIAAFLVAV
jgi:hypothetical protein